MRAAGIYVHTYIHTQISRCIHTYTHVCQWIHWVTNEIWVSHVSHILEWVTRPAWRICTCLFLWIHIYINIYIFLHYLCFFITLLYICEQHQHGHADCWGKRWVSSLEQSQPVRADVVILCTQTCVREVVLVYLEIADKCRKMNGRDDMKRGEDDVPRTCVRAYMHVYIFSYANT